MAVTGTSALTNSVKPLYDKDFLLAATGMEYHDQFSWEKPAMDGQRGSSIDFVIFENLNPQVTALTETSDVTPIAMSDSNISVAVSEYGGAVQRTALLKATSYNDVDEAAAKVIGINRARSVDIIARDVTVGGSNVFYSLGTAAARTDLTLTDKVSFPFLTEGVGRSRAWNMPSDEEDRISVPLGSNT